MLDLEKYLRQQAELAKQKKQIKKNAKTSRPKSDETIPYKKLKLSNINARQAKLVEKARSKINKTKLPSDPKTVKDLHKNSAINCETEHIKSNLVDDSTKEIGNSRNAQNLHNIFKDNTKEILDENVHDKCVDVPSDSGSEYVPSDEQIDLGKKYNRTFYIPTETFH